MAMAQLTQSEQGDCPYIPTWETYEYMKYGNIGASLYTGTINYSVPIFEYKDEDFNYSISVDYATNGFRVNHKSGFLGHGWSLSSPGMITREINGIADESHKTICAHGGNGVQLFGYNYTTTGQLNKFILVHNNNQAFTAMGNTSGDYFDSHPDIYRFNFGEFSGSFRRVPSNSNKPSFIFFDCSSKSQSLVVDSISNDNNTIILVDGNGYKYRFLCGEFTKETNDDAIGALLEKRVRKWNLYEIIAPNGRYIQFIYTPFSNVSSLDKSDHNVTYTPTLNYEHSFYAGTNEGNESSDINVYASDVFSTRLIGILLPDKTHIYIDYIDGVKELRYTYPNGDVAESEGDNKRINSISICSSDGTLMKKASFIYDVVGGYNNNDNRLTFLKSIDISGGGLFSFEYNTMTSYPPLGTIKSDHWGYFNGNNGGFNTTNFFSNISYDDNYNELYSPSFNKAPNFQAALSGTLRKISYPTGGFSTIEYEQHDCSKKVIRDNDSLFIPHLESLDINELIGGVRVWRIINYTSDGMPSDTVRYEYKSATNNNLSSGILINVPRYGIKYTTENNKYVERFNLCNSIYDFCSTHIEYSHIRECKSAAGFTDYIYNTYCDYPDDFDAQLNEDNDHLLQLFGYYSNGYNYILTRFSNPSPSVTNILTPIASSQTKRGLLSSTLNYNNEGVLISSKKYNYMFPRVCTDTILTLTGEIARDVIFPRHNINISSVEESFFYDNTPVSNKKISEYNSFGMETKSETTTSEGFQVTDTYQYVGDFENASGIIQQMKLSNNVNNLISNQRTISVNGIDHIIYKTRYNYYKPDAGKNTLFKISSVESWIPNKNWVVKETFSHDAFGRIVQQTDTSGIHTAYVWGYNGRYPLLMARNTSFEQLEQTFSANGLSVTSMSDSINYDNTTFETLVNSVASIPSSLVEIYQFKPNVGLIERSLPNALKAYYNYDGYGRLISVADSKHKILQQGEYQLTSIAPLSASMITSDCYVDETMNAVVTAEGASHTYQYNFNIFNLADSTLAYHCMNNSGYLDIIPYNEGILANHYQLQCDVSDLISGEHKLLCKDIYIKPAKLRFSNTSDQFIFSNGNAIFTSNIFTDTQTTATFVLEIISSENCTVMIGNTSFTFKREKEKEFSVPLVQGNNQISFSFPTSTVIFEATLSIKSATNGHEIDTQNSIYFSY